MIEELKKSGVPKQFENVYLVFGCSGERERELFYNL